jgi:hypothetical protein
MIEFISFPKNKSAYNGSAGRRRSTTSGPFAYITSIPAVCGKTFRFAPGLNILVGHNGAGKSTVLRACAQSLAAYQGGLSAVTQSWVQELCGFSGDTIQFPWNIAHDGQSLLFVDPRIAVGVAHGAFDGDFFSSGLMNTIANGSTGESTLRRISHAVGVILGEESIPAKVEWRMDKLGVNDVWKKRLGIVEGYLSGSIPPGPQTIILDEPETYLAISLQVRFWKRLLGEDPKRFENLQVIIASHSPFAFGIPHANYIEMKQGYIKECEDALAFAMV